MDLIELTIQIAQILSILLIPGVLIVAHRRNLRFQKRENAMDYIRQWTGPEYIERVQLSVKPLFLLAFNNDPTDAIVTYKGSYRAATEVLNYLEMVSLAIENRTADEEVLARYFQRAVLSLHKSHGPIIHFLREHHGGMEVYAGFDRLVKRWTVQAS